MAIDENLYVCPACKGNLVFKEDSVSCKNCFNNWEINEGIPCFIKDESYWCNYPQELMQKLNQLAAKEGWEKAVETLISHQTKEDIQNINRADAHYFLPLDRESIVLDAGCMWGELTIPLAKYVKKIVGIDSTFETLKFLDIRSAQMNLGNIELACADLLNLPFPNEIFDLVIMNGVMEWLGYRKKFVISEDYGKKSKNSTTNYGENPHELQMQGLKEAHRILRNGGTLFIGIENRYGYQYFHGTPDEHSGIRFVNLLPRRIADTYMKWKLNQDYRTYTYSYQEHLKNLVVTGFKEIEFCAVFPSYREPNTIIPLENEKLLRYYYENIKYPETPWIKIQILKMILGLGWGKYTVPSFLIMAKK